MPNFTRNFWRELGIMFFSAECNKGQTFEFVSPIKEFTLETPTVPLVTAGKFRGYSQFRDPVEWPALPTKTEGGIAFPGLHRLEALEDGAVYACVCELPQHLTEVTPDMFALDHVYVEGGTPSFNYADGYRAVIVMSGSVFHNGVLVGVGSKVDVPEHGGVVLEVTSPAHLVGYRLTSA